MPDLNSTPCEYCHCPLPAHLPSCPHCGRPSLFPNVKAAERNEESQALEQRYQATQQRVAHQNGTPSLRWFEQAVNEKAKVVLNRSYREVDRLSLSHTVLYGGFYKMVDSGTRIPEDNPWDSMRETVDSKLFPYYHKNVFFAALTLDETGLDHYGDCSVILQEDLVGHRASLFEENSAMFMEKNRIGVKQPLPPGFRAPWTDRSKLCTAKLAGDFDDQTTEDSFPGRLLKNGSPGGQDDDFVEVHIYGTLSVCTMEKVSAISPRKKGKKKIFRKLEERLNKYDVDLVMR